MTPILTDAEIDHLLTLPEVKDALIRFNRAQAYQTVDHDTRLRLVARVRYFERQPVPLRGRPR